MKNTQKGFAGIVVIIIIALVVGAGATYYIINGKKQTELLATADVDIDTKVSDQEQNTDVGTNLQADVRVQENTDNVALPQSQIPKGVYQFVELLGSGSSAQTWVYELGLPIGGEGNLTLTVDGFQVRTRINAIGRISRGSLDVVFDSYGPDNMFTPYLKGDTLFTLKPTASGLAIEWKKMKPNLPLNVASGYFVLKNNYFDND